jgi:hypothetical protein
MPNVFSRVGEAIGWSVAVVLSNLRDLGFTWRAGTPRERFRLVESGLWPLAAVVLLLVLAWPEWLWLLVAALTFRWLSDVGDVAQVVRWRAKMVRTLERQPTGAPRVANVRCSAGNTHRFVYGHNGWEDMGPSTEDSPETHAALST